MNLKTKMGLDLIQVERKLMENGYLVLGTHHNGFHYFTCENQEGLQIYVEVNSFCMGYDVSVNYKSKKGSGNRSGIIYRRHVSLELLYKIIVKGFESDFIIKHSKRINAKPESIISKITKALDQQGLLSVREKEILKNVQLIKQNIGVPEQYYIFEVYDSNGNGFEFGKTIHDTGYDQYSITCYKLKVFNFNMKGLKNEVKSNKFKQCCDY